MVVRLEKLFFGTAVSWERDLRWAYNNTDSRDEYYELKESIPPQFANETEAQLIAVIETITITALVATFVIPLLLQVVLKTAMQKVWSVFNTLQLIILLNLMALNLPSNVLAVHDQVNEIVNLNLKLKETIYGYIFGE